LALTQVYIHKQIKAFNADVKTIYMTHDSAFSSFWEERNENVLSMDYLCAQWTNLTPNAKIGYVSQYMKQLFTEKYMVEESAFVPTRGGVLFGEERFQSLNSEQIKGILQKYDIPLDKKLLFSWGRPVDYKRMDLIFSVSKHLSDDFFPVAVTNGSFPSLRHFINHHNLPGKLIENYKQFELIQALLQWSGTVTACLLSENEPGAIVPMEAMYLANNTGPIIIGNQNGIYNELIQDGVDGFLIENNLPKLAERIQQISQMSPAQLQQLRTNAYLKIVNFYDQKKNYIETLIHCIPQLKIHYEKLISLVK
jgi:glycosyltransferase involved in cell wall biosynthesis